MFTSETVRLRVVVGVAEVPLAHERRQISRAMQAVSEGLLLVGEVAQRMGVEKPAVPGSSSSESSAQVVMWRRAACLPVSSAARLGEQTGIA